MCATIIPSLAESQIRPGAPISNPYSIIQLEGESLPKLLGKPISEIRVYRKDVSGFRPVVFQIDQVADNGELICPLGPKPDRRESDGIFDANDLLLMMAFDTGEPFDNWQDKPFGEVAHLIQVHDKSGAVIGEVAAFIEDGSHSLSKKDYVSFDQNLHRTAALGYELGSRPGSPALVEHIVPSPAINNVNIIDRLKMRADGWMLFHWIHIKRNENDIVSKLLAYIDGPVRVVRKMNYALRAIWGFKTPYVTRTTPAYAYHASFPNDMKVPIKLDAFFTDAKLVSGFDFRPEAGELKIYTDDFKTPILVNGKMDDIENNLDRFNPLWFVVQGNFGCMMFYIVLNDDLRKTGIVSRLAYTDDISIAMPPENVPGSYGQVLYEMENVLQMPKGTHKFEVLFYFAPPCSGRDMEKPVLESRERLLKAHVVTDEDD